MNDNGRLPADPLLCSRAIVGWYLSRSAPADPVPSGQYVAAFMCQHEETRYAVVTTTNCGNISGGTDVLAVYLIRPNDSLARLNRWPAEIECC